MYKPGSRFSRRVSRAAFNTLCALGCLAVLLGSVRGLPILSVGHWHGAEYHSHSSGGVAHGHAADGHDDGHSHGHSHHADHSHAHGHAHSHPHSNDSKQAHDPAPDSGRQPAPRPGETDLPSDYFCPLAASFVDAPAIEALLSAYSLSLTPGAPALYDFALPRASGNRDPPSAPFA